MPVRVNAPGSWSGQKRSGSPPIPCWTPHAVQMNKANTGRAVCAKAERSGRPSRNGSPTATEAPPAKAAVPRKKARRLME